MARTARWRLAWSLGLAAALLIALLSMANLLLGRGISEGRRRSSFSTRADGFRGLFEVLSRLGYPADRHRLSYGQLPPPGSSVLVIIDPLPAQVLAQDDKTRLDASQVRSLKSWISEGGRLLAGLSGRPAINVFGMDVGVVERREDDVWAGFLGVESTDVLSVILDKKVPYTEWVPATGIVSGTGEGNTLLRGAQLGLYGLRLLAAAPLLGWALLRGYRRSGRGLREGAAAEGGKTGEPVWNESSGPSDGRLAHSGVVAPGLPSEPGGPVGAK